MPLRHVNYWAKTINAQKAWGALYTSPLTAQKHSTEGLVQEAKHRQR